MILRAGFSKQPSKYSVVFEMASVCVRELVNLQVFMNTDGFACSISKFRNNNIRPLNKIHIKRAMQVSEQSFSRKLQEDIAGGDLNSGCSQSHPWFLLPYKYWLLCAFAYLQRIFTVVFECFQN